MSLGIDPRAVDTMSIYEILSASAAYSRLGKPKPISEEDFDEMLVALRNLKLPDVKVH